VILVDNQWFKSRDFKLILYAHHIFEAERFPNKGFGVSKEFRPATSTGEIRIVSKEQH
jgi:hypothetical protein